MKRNPIERAFAQIRRAKGWSRVWAADRLEISAGYLGRLERGTAPLTLPMEQRMAGVYGVDLNELTRPPARAAGGQ